MRWWNRLLVALVVLGASSVSATAIEPRPLPAFRVHSADGAVVTSGQLSGDRRWVLIYALPDCLPCDDVIRLLKDSGTPALVERTVLVIGAQPAEAAAYARSRLPREVSGVRWYADAQGEAWLALGLHGTPVIIGIRDGRIVWVMSGALKDAAASVVRSWVED